ncbi:MAG TPA: hypothetical protein VFR55_07060 [Dehalococcoidia bacterium]|nr:hypothetical protein [Dehalococcoidia bacterium]
MDRRVLIIVMVLIVSVFVLILAVGFTGDNGKVEIPAWLQDFGFKFDKGTGEGSSQGGFKEKLSSPLSVDDLGPTSSFCRKQFIENGLNLSSGQTRCEFVINKSESWLASTREISLHLGEGSSVKVELIQPDQLTVRKQLTPQQPDASIDIFKEGGVLTIECEGSGQGPNCQLEFK